MKTAAKKAWETRRRNELEKLERTIDRRYRGIVAAIVQDFHATGGGKVQTRRVNELEIPRRRDGSVDIGRMPVGDAVEASDTQIAAALAPRRTARENARRVAEAAVAAIAAGDEHDSLDYFASFGELLTADVANAIVELELKAEAIRKAIHDAKVAEYGTGDDIPF